MANFSLSESPIPRRAGSSSPRSASTRDWEEFSSALLEDGFVLTALELHTELLECGKEVPSLRDYFSNPGNFEHAIPQPPSGLLHSTMVRTSSLSTFDSIELGRYSDDLDKEADDRVAVLEFELRKAYETIKSLRGSLTEATEIAPTKDGEVSSKIRTKSDDPIKPHEKRALNFLTHEYLMQQDNKLTAITFTEENGDQDFDDWDDVGLNISKPPDLLYLFRNYSTCMLSDKEKVDRIKNLEDELSTLTGENLALKREIEALQLRSKKKHSVSSARGEDDRKSLHRRGSSLTNLSEVTGGSGAVTEMKKRGHVRNRSSPEIDAEAAVKPSSADTTRPPTTTREGGKESAEQGVVGETRAVEADVFSKTDGSQSELSRSTGSAVSAATLSVDDDADTVIDETEQKQQLRKEDALHGEEDWEQRHSKDRSVSTSTIQNDKTDDGEFEVSVDSKNHMSVAFRQELLSISQLKTDSRIGVEVTKLSDPNLDLVQLLARCLPYIMPNVVLAKREELIPVLLCVISRHSDSKVRDHLLHMMFNLIKRPDKNQRQVIMSSCVAFAKLTGPTRVESELLPQMWEQITHKHYERRLLVAESCGVLAPYIPPELRGSLMLSMLKQMLSEDKAESVRQAVVRSLAVIVAFVDDDDKFKQCWELMLKALTDPSQLVTSSTYSSLLPALAAWAFELGTLESEMLSYFLHQLLTCVKQVSRSDGETSAVEQSHHHLLTLTHLVPWHFATILLSGPYVQSMSDDIENTVKEVTFPKPSSPLLDISIIVGDNTRLSALVAGFEGQIESKTHTPWKSLEWFQTEMINKLQRVAVTLDFSQSELVHSLSVLLSSYCTYLGHTYTHKMIKPHFERSLKLPKHNPGAALAEGQTQLTTPVLPVFVSGILACFPKDEKLLVSYLRSTIVDLALYFGPLDSLKATIAELKRNRHSHALILGLMQDLVGHSSFQVRRYVAILLGLMIRGVDEKLVLKGVLPQLTKLARDTEISVRVDTIGSFGTIMATVTSKDVLVRVHEQFELFMSEEQYKIDHQVLMGVLRTLAKIGPLADPVFRDEFIIPRLSDIAKANNHSQNTTKRQDIALTLLDAYRNISECFVSVELLTTYILPSLECLLLDMEATASDKVVATQQLISNCNSKIQEYKKSEVSTEHPSHSDGKASSFLNKLRPNFDRTRADLSISPSKFFKRKS